MSELFKRLPEFHSLYLCIQMCVSLKSRRWSSWRCSFSHSSRTPSVALNRTSDTIWQGDSLFVCVHLYLCLHVCVWVTLRVEALSLPHRYSSFVVDVLYRLSTSSFYLFFRHGPSGLVLQWSCPSQWNSLRMVDLEFRHVIQVPGLGLPSRESQCAVCFSLVPLTHGAKLTLHRHKGSENWLTCAGCLISYFTHLL